MIAVIIAAVLCGFITGFLICAGLVGSELTERREKIETQDETIKGLHQKLYEATQRRCDEKAKAPFLVG